MLAAMNDLPWPGPRMTVQPQPDRERKKEFSRRSGCPPAGICRSTRNRWRCYYDYLAAHLELPFVACYPRPSSPAHAAVDRCEVIELLDPRTDLCDEFDGIYCQTRKGRFLVNLPLVELTVLRPSKNLELLADYEYWFWHWRG